MNRTILIIVGFTLTLGLAITTFIYFASRTATVVVAPPSTTLPTSTEEPAPVGPVDTVSTTPVATTPASVIGRLVKISSGPVVPGEMVVNMKAQTASSSSEAIVHYIERQSGNVFSYNVRTGTITRTNNRTLPGIQSAAWLPDASAAIVQYLSDPTFSTVNTYVLPAVGSNGFFLPQNLSGVAAASTSILTLASGPNGSSASLIRTDGTHATTIFNTALSSIRASFTGAGQYLVFTKPSATLLGDAFLVNTTGRFVRIAGPRAGLVAVASHAGAWVLVSYTQNNTMTMQLVNTKTGEALSLPLSTIADKCAWTADDASIYCGIPISPSTDYTYPDDWYQGAVQFSDRLWKIDVAGRFAQLVLDFNKEAGAPLDATALALDPAEKVITFVNKTDGALWAYQL